ncbi:hypothetical protein [Roseimaritima sediminicola]|uniref:hypothetical protein n=1 Tax=Roseimaritima sediminicola TaxID=2662066 RepID=UPI001298586B|nr:hypothetical protein [Roseimaritima sediminicola]
MTRHDLLALSDDDLAATTNRGTVKRARRELETGKLTCELTLDGETLTVRWSDQTVCVFPAGQTIHEAQCSSGTSGISRHVIRSVLAYQRLTPPAADPEPPLAPAGPPSAGGKPAGAEHPLPMPAETPAATPANSRETSEPGSLGRVWDPGQIDDEALVACFGKAAVNKARRIFKQGVLVELSRGPKPTARFLHESCTVRFPVPEDVRYARADCADVALAGWVSMAVWGFRQLPPEQRSAVLSLQPQTLPVDAACLDAADALLAELLTDGLDGLHRSWPSRLARAERAVRGQGLVWPADLLAELALLETQYRDSNARFDPALVVRTVGEWTARRRAILADTGAAAQVLIRGTKSDRPVEIKAARLIGLGLGVVPGKRHTSILAYFQNTDTGAVAALKRGFTDTDPQQAPTPKSFSDLAGVQLQRGVSLESAAHGQLLLAAGKRTPADELVLPRGPSRMTVNPQSFRWENLAPPLLLESFRQAIERLQVLPPDWLLPRRHTQNLQVLSTAGAADVGFDEVHQRLVATLRDADGQTARLVHPYHHRGAVAFSALSEVLGRQGAAVRFVFGHVSLRHRQLQVQPMTVICEDADGTRTAVSAWTGRRQDAAHEPATDPTSERAETSPITAFTKALRQALADAVLMGLEHGDVAAWQRLYDDARRLGFVRLASPLGRLLDEGNARSNRLRWGPQAAVAEAIDLCMFSRMLD